MKKLYKNELSRQKSIESVLGKLYPEVRSELNFENPYQLVVAVSLSAQCTDKKVNEVTPSLFARFNDFSALSKASTTEIEKIIRPINYYRTKSKNIRAMAEAVITRFSGKLPLEHKLLTSLPGVGRKTANVVLSELKIEPAIPVDTHVFRLANRLGLSKGKTPDDVERDLQQRFESSKWYHLHHWLIYHGRRVCKAQRPLCEACSLAKLCPSSTVKR